VADEIGPLVTILAPPANSYVRLQVPVQAQATDQGSGVASFTVRVGAQPLTATLTPSLPPPASSYRCQRASAKLFSPSSSSSNMMGGAGLAVAVHPEFLGVPLLAVMMAVALRPKKGC
jgi:hypothetical protein